MYYPDCTAIVANVRIVWMYDLNVWLDGWVWGYIAKMEKKNVLFFLVQRPICSKNETGDLLKDKAFYIRHIIQTATALLWQPQSRKSQSIPQYLVKAGRGQAGSQ